MEAGETPARARRRDMQSLLKFSSYRLTTKSGQAIGNNPEKVKKMHKVEILNRYNHFYDASAVGDFLKNGKNILKGECKMKNINAKKFFAVLLSLALIVVIAFTMAACTAEKPADDAGEAGETASLDNPPEVTVTSDEPLEPVVVGEGETAFSLKVTHSDGAYSLYTVNTDKKTVGEALIEQNIISGDDGPYGLYVKTVDYETLDYDTDKMYWSFYENGNYAAKGVDQTPITDGATYEFKAEK